MVVEQVPVHHVRELALEAALAQPAHRCKEGLTKAEVMRCLKRDVARESFYYLVPLKAA